MTKEIYIYYQRYETDFQEKTAQLQHELGRQLLAYGLWKQYNLTFTEEMIQYVENKKPVLKRIPGYPEIFFNISHCRGLVACGITTLAPLGIDVEGERKFSDGLLKKVCSPQELSSLSQKVSMEEFLSLWTLKESYIKMTGEGLKKPLRTLSFQKSDADILCNWPGYFWQSTLQEKYVLSISCEKAFPPPLFLETKDLKDEKPL